MLEQTANCTLFNGKGLLFKTENEYVYCAVRNEFLYKTSTFRLQSVNI